MLSIILYPLFFNCGLLIFWLLYKIVRKKSFSHVIERFMISCGMSMQFFLSPIINSLSDFLNCTELNGNSYMTNFLIERCNNNEKYFLWKYCFVIPCFSIFAILIPVITYFYMRKNRNKLFDKSMIYKIGYLLNGYSPDSFYWYPYSLSYFYFLNLGSFCFFSKKFP